jgi:hypothetical protein
MDLLYFLKARAAFVRHFYNVTSTPFTEAKRKIERGEAPFEPHSAKYEGEPAFTTEWIEAERCLEVLGRVCISMLSASLKLYFDTWRAHLRIELQPEETCVLKRHGVLKGYKWIFGSRLGIEWANCPADFTVLEQIFLARNREQLPDYITTQSVGHHRSDLEKYAEPFFLSDTDRKILAEDPEFAGNPFFSFSIHVTGEKLLAATKEVEALAEWLEPWLIAERLRR